MVRKHPPEVRRRVVELWLDGNTYKDIYAETGASPASSSSIIDRTRKQVPDIDELRRLNIFLKNAGANLRDALRTVSTHIISLGNAKSTQTESSKRSILSMSHGKQTVGTTAKWKGSTEK